LTLKNIMILKPRWGVIRPATYVQLEHWWNLQTRGGAIFRHW